MAVVNKSIQPVNIGISKISKIYHIADVHIRNLKRHQEYLKVFESTVAYIKETASKDDVIFLAGDIVHAKTDMSPELVQVVQDFLRMMSDTLPTIMIAGNHDCNLNNKSRLDALTPIVNALNHPNLHYLRDSGIYQIADKHFVVMSVFDKPRDFIKASDFEAPYKIALHHGAVNNSVTDTGVVIQNEHVTADVFHGYDLTLLGDIHKANQYLNNEKTIAYPGSLIQQNYGEGLIHGLIVWDVTASPVPTFKEIENSYCYYTIEVKNGDYEKPSIDLTGKIVRLRVKNKNTDPTVIKEIVASFKNEYNIEDVVTQRINDFSKRNSEFSKNHIGDVRDIEYQNQLISEYLMKQYPNMSKTMIDGIRQLNRTVNSIISKQDVNKNIAWIPIKFEFSNMFSYGEDNLINFSDMKGSYGLFAPNASGKSTLLDAITYCIFDKCSRSTKSIHVLNNKSTWFSCKFEFELDGKRYFIEKKGARGKNEHVRVDVNFYTIDDLGNEISLNGKERSETNDIIRKILGTYDDFVLTALSVQNNSTGFIDMAQRERKDLLGKFLDIRIFDELNNAASVESKEVQSEFKFLEKKNYPDILAATKNELKKSDEILKELENNEQEVSLKIQEKTNQLIETSSRLVIINSKVGTDKSAMEKECNELTKKNVQFSSSIDEIHAKIETNSDRIFQLKTALEGYDFEGQKDKVSLLDELHAEEKRLSLDLSSKSTSLSHNESKMEKLTDLKYDENCNFCMSNIFVKDAIETKKKIVDDRKEVEFLKKAIKSCKKEISILKACKDDLDKHLKMHDLLTKIELQQKEHQVEISSLKIKIDSNCLKIQQIKNAISEYEKQEEQIQNNVLVQEEMNSIENELHELRKTLKDVSSKKMNVGGKIVSCKEKIKESEEGIKKLKSLSNTLKYYQHYLEAVSRDGVPYSLIQSTVPFLEHEINNILSQLVDFNIILHMDGKNIDCHIVYDADNFWPIELSSGMEKFISSLAIRTALINISTLPRPNFMAIDEGLGSLDANVLSDFANLLQYLESQFAFILLISHIDSSRDMVSTILEISKRDGFSHIRHE